MLRAPYCWQRHRVQWTRGYCTAVLRWSSNCIELRYKSSALIFYRYGRWCPVALNSSEVCTWWAMSFNLITLNDSCYSNETVQTVLQIYTCMYIGLMRMAGVWCWQFSIRILLSCRLFSKANAFSVLLGVYIAQNVSWFLLGQYKWCFNLITEQLGGNSVRSHSMVWNFVCLQKFFDTLSPTRCWSLTAMSHGVDGNLTNDVSNHNNSHRWFLWQDLSFCFCTYHMRYVVCRHQLVSRLWLLWFI